MKFDVKYTDGFRCYIAAVEDGRFALIDLESGQVEWSKMEESFLRFGPFREVTERLSDQVMAELENFLEGRVKLVEPDAEQTAKYLMEKYADILELEETDED